MTRPPSLPARVLGWALGPGDDARAVQGDLNEDFASRAARDGLGPARRWYWLEALALSGSALGGRLTGRPVAGTRRDGLGRTARRVLSSNGATQDLRYALRALRRDRFFAAFTTLVIGLGVGASTAVYSVLSPLFIESLPFVDAGRLVLIENGFAEFGLSGLTSRTSNVRDFRERASSFEAIAGYNAFFDQGSYNLTGDGNPARLVAVNVTTNFLDVLGVVPFVGRNFLPEEGDWGGFVAVDAAAPRTAMLTHAFWVQRFGADPTVVGGQVTLNEESVTVVGVLPADFDFASVFSPTTPVDLLIPWPIADVTDRWGNTTTMVARLAPAASVQSAQAELDAVVGALAEEDADRWGLDGNVAGLQERIARPVRAPMLLLAAAAGIVMLIVCVNVSNMLLARAPRRRREMAVRQALGATRPRLVRQLLLESVALAFAGAGLGLGVALVVTRIVSAQGGLDIPMLTAVSIDASALVFTVGVAVLTGVAVGAVPALQVSEGGAQAALGGTSRGGGGTHGARRFREGLVVAEVALACVLLVMSGLVVRSFQRVMDVELGFEPDHAIAWKLASSRSFESGPEAATFYESIAANAAAVPGVEAVGLVDALPLGTDRTWGMRIADKQYEDEQVDQFFPHIVDPGYLETMGIGLVEGRYFTSEDRRGSSFVAIVNERAARNIFPDGVALGRMVETNSGPVEVVGVVADVRHRSLELTGDNEIYLTMQQMWAYSTVELVVRTSLPIESVVPPVNAAIREIEAQIPTEDIRALSSLVERSVSPRRFTLQVLVAFGLSALLLAAAGIYGVLSYSVSERVPELGIRMALGESAASILRGVLARTALLAGLGIGIGLAAAVGLGRLIDALLFGVTPTDPVTFAAIIAVLLVVALGAGLVPALRAARTDSAGAIRSLG